jgi:hypothetical protein
MTAQINCPLTIHFHTNGCKKTKTFDAHIACCPKKAAVVKLLQGWDFKNGKTDVN